MSERWLARLEEARRRRPWADRTARLLGAARRVVLRDADEVIRLHDTVLFLRAYPHSRRVLLLCEEILSTLGRRVARLAEAGADLSAFDHPEVSGIAATAITTDYSFDVVTWLKRRFGRRVSADWESDGAADRRRALWPRSLPLLEEEATEDANVPYLDYLRAARRRGEDDLSWLLERIEALPVSPAEKAEWFESQGISVRWDLGDTAHTRTRLRFRSSRPFFHDAPLWKHGVSIEAELASPRLPVERLSLTEGRAVLEMTRESTALRYREYYGFTYGDPSSVLRARAGRGLEIYLLGLERDRRLPLRAGFAGFFVKNGVPVGYIEALAFFERVEVGFNIYYAFREGESAWIFARVVKLLHQVLGVTSFSMDPYQLGHENEEAIHSGAFWFYRKLGFRSTDPRLRALTSREEARIASDSSYRTPPATLRRLAKHNLLYEIPSSPGAAIRSDWDRFHMRNLSLAVIRRMARDFGGDAAKIRRSSEASVARALGEDPRRWSAARRRAFGDLALVLALIPDLARWSRDDKLAILRILRAKTGPDEESYLHLQQRHARLRAAVLALGTG